MNAHDILMKVRDEILTDESRWTKGPFAKNREGEQVPPEDSAAACWCLAGARRKAAEGCPNEGWAAREALDAATPRGFTDFIEYNEDEATTFSDIRALLDRAIAATEGEPT